MIRFLPHLTFSFYTLSLHMFVKFSLHLMFYFTFLFSERMNASGKSKSAQKRLQKEKDLYESSWKLADSMYTELWSDRWMELKNALLKPPTYLKCYPGTENVPDTFESHQSIKFMEVGSNRPDSDSSFILDREALFLYDLLNPSEGDNILGMFKNFKKKIL